MPRDYDRPRDRDDRDRDDRDDDDDRPRRRRRDDDGDDDDQPRRRGREYDDRAAPPGNGAATAALVLGLLAFCTGPLTGIPAIICGFIGMGKPVAKGLAITGILLGVIGSIGGVVVGYFGYMAAESSRDRMTDANNMKQIGLAMHNQHDMTGRLSGPYTQDNFGKVNKGLSWRVGILPYIEQDNIYKQFNMNEAWDGPRNRSVSGTSIKTFTSPYDGLDKGSVNTPYRVFYGDGALFEEDGRPVSLATIPDGSSNTIMVVHAMEQVQWAEPRDLKYAKNGPLPKLGHPKVPGVIQVLLADGSVRMIRSDISERTLRQAITKADGEFMGADW